MKKFEAGRAAIEVLLAARRIADHAKEAGALCNQSAPRATCSHMGAILADSVLQAGINYMTVVRPRVLNIMQKYPTADTISVLLELVQKKRTGELLNWQHHEKVTRFEDLVAFLNESDIEDAQDLRTNLASEHFCSRLRSVNGVGPKTVDYMACLVGVDSIAVDRHVRTFAKTVGVENNDYHFLRRSFCCAADLLELPRREFDSWLWRRAALSSQKQLSFAI